MKIKITDGEIREKNLKDSKADIERWKKLLNSRMEENVYLKNMLSDILKNNFDQDSLEEIEEFQTRFISEDELIISLRKDVYHLDNLLSVKMLEDGKLEKTFHSKMQNLQNDIPNSTKRFQILKSAFHDFKHKIYVKAGNLQV